MGPVCLRPPLLRQNLRSAGDEVLRIEGVLSAFLSYVFNRISPGPDCSGGGSRKEQEEPVAFSKACWEAAEQGERRRTYLALLFHRCHA